MLTDKQMEDALKVFQDRMQGVTDLYYRKMGEHIRDIGQLAPSDVHRLQQLRRMNRNLSEVKKRLAQAAGMNVRDIEKILEQAAEVDDRVVKKILGVSDASVRLPNNVPLQRALRAQIAETRGRLSNLSNTTANQKAYQKAVDAAVTAVQSGAEDYESAIRRVLRQAGEMGLRVRDGGTSAVEYASGHTRRVDTAVRMNVLDAMRRMNQQVMHEVGEQFGANGVEIDAHMLCAEDHLPYQGQQFTNEEFEQIQDSLDRPFGEWNCRHTWAPIIVGVSPRAYTDEDVERFARFSTEEIEIDGTTKTRYEWSQAMRRMETAIREKKDTATLARYAGDESLRRECQGSVNAMVKAYERLSDKAGLGPDYRRTFVAGFKDVGVDEFTAFKSLADFDKQISALESQRQSADAADFNKAEDESILEKIAHLRELRETWSDANKLAGGDKDIRRALLSSDPTEVVRGIERAIGGDRFGLPDSKWSGKAEARAKADMPRNTIGTAVDSTKDIWIRKDYLHNFTVGIHEDLHLRSIHRYDDPDDRRWVRDNIKGYEEGVVQLRAETICEKVGIKPLRTYSGYTSALRVLNKTLEPHKAEYDFIKDLFDKTPVSRYNYCEQLARELKDKHPRKWNRLGQDIENALTTLRKKP